MLVFGLTGGLDCFNEHINHIFYFSTSVFALTEPKPSLQWYKYELQTPRTCYVHLKNVPIDVPAKNIPIPTYILQGSLNRPHFLQRRGSRMSRVWALAPSSQSFNPKPFMGTKMSALSRGCATFLG